LYIYLGVCNLTHYKTKEVFSSILTHIGHIIRNQKYTGAAIGIFNANLIGKDLGLMEKTENTNLNYSTEITKEEAKIIRKSLDEKY
jgi:uncharacterized protein YkvS